MDMNRIYSAVAALTEHGIRNGLTEECDRVYVINRILDRLRLDEFDENAVDAGLVEELCMTEASDTGSKIFTGLERTLAILLDYAAENGLLSDNTTVYRDIFDTALMDCLLPRPSQVRAGFEKLYADDPRRATDNYYAFSRASDYIRTYRVARDIKWTAETEYGEMIITINLSKPEKDPKAIAAALSMKQSAYPKCQLCSENEGYAGRVNHPARNNHRIIPVTINGKPWFLQYSPYVYYNEHCIVFNSEHTPMKIDREAFAKLLDFIGQFPHYMVGSNADLPIVGGSILTHDHFQGGNFEFPMAKAEIEKHVKIKGFEDIEAGIVKWPMTVLRIRGTEPGRLTDCAEKVLNTWREYSDEEAFIYAYTEAATGRNVTDASVDYAHHGSEYIPHNTITPIARRRGAVYELDLVLRNNITTEEHPLGVFHPHAEYHHIKKENIGLIEVMGLAILPARLKNELSELKNAMLEGRNLYADENLKKHAEWADEIRRKYSSEELDSEEKLNKVLRREVGLVYSGLLEQCAVFKRDDRGQAQFMRFIESIK